jgi:phosphoserine phosphatase RsbU/P
MNRIVVIEDDPAIRRGLADNLRLESYDVLTAADGETGYRLVREQQPDLIILDLMLPGMNGYDVCGHIRRLPLATPILMLTADDSESSRIRGFDAGADDYVAKPFSIRELLGRVRAILRRSQSRSERANQRELEEARHIQKGLMPVEIPQVSGLRIAALWRPADTVGGDYFDVLKLNQTSVAVCIADVCGKGLPAALMMSNLQATVRAYASESASPQNVCEKVNRAMCVSTPLNTFVSFFYAVIDADRRRLTYCNAGHNPPILSRRNGLTQTLDCGGGILGVFENWKYAQQEVPLDLHDHLLMYTDGVTESHNAAGEEFGERRLINLALRLGNSEPIEITETLLLAVTEFNNGNFEDDLTVLALAVDV